jgi:hypothetical protein
MRVQAVWNPLRSVLGVLAIALPVMGLLTGAIVSAAGVLAWLTDSSFEYAYFLATLCALIAFLFVAVFHFRQEKLVLPVQDRPAFLGRLRAQLKALGYCAKVRQSERQVFKPSFQALLLGGKVRLRLTADTAYLDGPRMFLEILRKRLRVQNHLEKDLRVFWDAKRRQNERLLVRAQIAMRVTGKPWQGVCRRITEVLQREGADVQCEVVLRAHSADGIRDRLLDGLIREWLIQKDIPVTMTRERLDTVDTGSRFEFALAAAKEKLAGCLADTAGLEAEKIARR